MSDTSPEQSPETPEGGPAEQPDAGPLSPLQWVVGSFLLSWGFILIALIFVLIMANMNALGLEFAGTQTKFLGLPLSAPAGLAAVLGLWMVVTIFRRMGEPPTWIARLPVLVIAVTAGYMLMEGESISTEERMQAILEAPQPGDTFAIDTRRGPFCSDCGWLMIYTDDAVVADWSPAARAVYNRQKENYRQYPYTVIRVAGVSDDHVTAHISDIIYGDLNSVVMAYNDKKMDFDDSTWTIPRAVLTLERIRWMSYTRSGGE